MVAPIHHRRRSPALRAAQRRKMARSVHAYVRGSTTRFYEWLADLRPHSLPDGPPVWICGDCHVGNLGPVADAEDDVKIAIRDLDQTVVGNPAHDLIRLALSLAAAARSSNLPGIATAAMLERMTAGYRRAFASGDAAREVPKRPDGVRVVMRDAMRRTWKELARERIDDTSPRIPLGARYWPVAAEERVALERLARSTPLRRLVRQLKHRDDDCEVRLLDAAYWMKGCSSLGRLRYALLLGVGRGRGARGELCLIDVKEAIAAAAPRYQGTSMPDGDAERVVAGACALTPALGERMFATRLLDRAAFVRELRPQDLKLELERLDREQAVRTAEFLAWVVGRAHARQLDAAARRAWRRELGADRLRTVDAPGWLWKSVVELLAAHEAAYLEHCRRYAREDAA